MASEGFIDQAAVERSLSTLRQRTSAGGLTGALNEVITGARALFSASGAGVMMLDDNTLLCAVAATNEPARLLEQRQEQTGHGPCVDALTLDRTIHTADLAVDDRWPELLPEVPEAGVRAVLGVPIRASGVAVGSLNVYRAQPGEWNESELFALEPYGNLIEGLLLSALQAHEHEQLVHQLQHALDHRVVIERAVGAVMERDRVDAVAAFNQLREQARRSQRKAAEVAVDLLAEITDGR